ncbi:hypothetical protein [Rhizobium sp. IMFF44]|uniref:hypothetical protein n=1 Tax=Rhizobium sp. IMFF44 TaxID=3342350 RepID=UPI0035BAD025
MSAQEEVLNLSELKKVLARAKAKAAREAAKAAAEAEKRDVPVIVPRKVEETTISGLAYIRRLRELYRYGVKTRAIKTANEADFMQAIAALERE